MHLSMPTHTNEQASKPLTAHAHAALPAPTAAAHIMLKPSDATPETAAAPSPRLTESPVLKPRSSVRSSKSLVRSSLTKPPNSIQLRTALRASHAKRSEVQV